MNQGHYYYFILVVFKLRRLKLRAGFCYEPGVKQCIGKQRNCKPTRVYLWMFNSLQKSHALFSVYVTNWWRYITKADDILDVRSVKIASAFRSGVLSQNGGTWDDGVDICSTLIPHVQITKTQDSKNAGCAAIAVKLLIVIVSKWAYLGKHTPAP